MGTICGLGAYFSAHIVAFLRHPGVHLPHTSFECTPFPCSIMLDGAGGSAGGGEGGGETVENGKFTTAPQWEQSVGPNIDTVLKEALPGREGLDAFESVLDRRGAPLDLLTHRFPGESALSGFNGAASGVMRGDGRRVEGMSAFEAVGVPQNAPLSLFGRGLWPRRLLVVASGVGVTLAVLSVEVLCMFREMCFTRRPSNVPFATDAIVPLAAALALVVFPLAFLAARLHRRLLVLVALVVAAGSGAGLLVASLWAFAEANEALVAKRASAAWDAMTAFEQSMWKGRKGLEETMGADTVAVASFSLALSILLLLSTLLLFALSLIWSATSVDPNACFGLFALEHRGREPPLKATIKAKTTSKFLQRQQQQQQGEGGGGEEKEEESKKEEGEGGAGEHSEADEGKEDDGDDEYGGDDGAGAGKREEGERGEGGEEGEEEEEEDPYGD